MIAPPERKAATSNWLIQRAIQLLRPLMGEINPEQAKLNLEGRASDHDARADRLESFARPFHLYALTLSHLGDSMPKDNRQWQTLLEQCLHNGSDPEHGAYWGPCTNFHQHIVEMGLLVLSLEISREHFWNQLAPATQNLFLDWLETARCVATHWNNHMFFGIYTLEFLKKEGRERPTDQALIDGWFRELESMYRGEGWFRDGLNDSVDYYNAYAFHYYGLNWCLYFADDQDARRQFWTDAANRFLASIPYVFAKDGGIPNFGRSQTYRFATLAPLGPAIQLGCCPLPDSEVRRLAEDHLDFFLTKPIYTQEGWLNIGWTDENPAIAESYSCISSTYWAAKGLSLLLLPREHSFWQAAPSDPDDVYVDGHRHANSVGLTLRRFDGDTEIINSGSAISLMNLRYFASKWSKLVYRSSAGTVLPDKATPFPLDLSLVADFEDVRLGRHVTHPAEFGDQHILCCYTLGEKTFEQMVAVQTHIAWNGPWLFLEHTLQASEAFVMRQGGFSLGHTEECIPDANLSEELGIRLSNRKFTSLLQPLFGFATTEVERDDPTQGRRHTLYPHHAIPVAVAPIPSGESRIACLIYFGPPGQQASPWTAEANGDILRLNHPYYQHWKPRND